jgi:hypothetical protein
MPCRPGCDLGSVVRPDVLQWARLGERVGQALKDAIRSQPPRHQDRKATLGELVDHAQHPERSAVLGPVLNQVLRLDVVRPLRPQAHARAVVEPQTAPAGLLARHFQPLPLQDPVDRLDVYPFSNRLLVEKRAISAEFSFHGR